MIRKYAYNIYKDHYFTTLAPRLIKKKISIMMPKYNIKFNLNFSILDVMGEEAFRETELRSYLNGLSGAFLVCDVTRPATLENLIYWVDVLYKECERDIPVIFMANKSDLTNGHMFDLASEERLSEVFNAPWLLTSAKNGDNLKEGFDILGMKIINKYLGKRKSILE